MQVIYGEIGTSFYIPIPLTATIGNFDGVHLGHQALINECKRIGKGSIVFTFDPCPNCILKSRFEYFCLTTLDRKIELIKELNPDILFIIKFDIKAASASKDDVMTWLKENNVQNFVCGEDFHFGYKALGTVEDLKKQFQCYILPNKILNNQRISSTCIRDLIEEGRITEANKALGHLYSIDGVVMKGNHIGNSLGFPTANIDIFGHQAPKKGVYAVKILYNGTYYHGMANFGNNPTLNYTMNTRLEIFIFDFNKDIYGALLRIFFLDFIREEKTFKNKEELIHELQKNHKQVLKIMEKDVQ